MLSREENELLTKVGPGTPMGELYRRFWLPVLLLDELPQPDGVPVRLRVLGEDLVAFRDSNGQVGLLDAYCPHRRPQLFFGRNEHCGIRCAYHGWKFDVNGQCTDIPSDPPEHNFADRVKIAAYPTREYGGLLWAYMGPKDKMPELPKFEWATLPAENRFTFRWLQETNWLQGMEGEIDTAHTMFVHSVFDAEYDKLQSRRWDQFKHQYPRLTVKETDYGFVYGGRYEALDDQYYWRCTQWLLPSFSLTPSKGWPRGGRFWLPIDDENVCTFNYWFHPDRPLTEEERVNYAAGVSFPPASTRVVHTLKDGYKIDIWRPVRNGDNDYLIDRDLQRDKTYTGIFGINDQDRCQQESMGPIVKREMERLGASDVAIIAARRRLIKMAKDLQNGIEPYAASHGDIYGVRSHDTLSNEGDFDKFIDSVKEKLVAKA